MAKTDGPRANDLLDQLWEDKGTDLLLTPGVSPMLRVDGDLSRMDGYGPLSAADTDRMMRELTTPDQAVEFDSGIEVDFSFTWRQQAGSEETLSGLWDRLVCPSDSYLGRFQPSRTSACQTSWKGL
jgi:hypothetical protein